MILSVFAIGGAILGATTVAGLLMLYQVRATTDSQNSAKAVFAADSGAEWALFDFYCDATSTSDPVSRCVGAQREQAPLGAFGNLATVSVACYGGSGAPPEVPCSSTTTVVYAVAKGFSLNSRRAFLVNLRSATATLP